MSYVRPPLVGGFACPAEALALTVSAGVPSLLKGGWGCLLPISFPFVIITRVLRLPLASGNTHIKTFSFWSFFVPAGQKWAQHQTKND